MAQLVARGIWDAEVADSSSVAPTIKSHMSYIFLYLKKQKIYDIIYVQKEKINFL